MSVAHQSPRGCEVAESAPSPSSPNLEGSNFTSRLQSECQLAYDYGGGGTEKREKDHYTREPQGSLADGELTACELEQFTDEELEALKQRIAERKAWACDHGQTEVVLGCTEDLRTIQLVEAMRVCWDGDTEVGEPREVA